MSRAIRPIRPVSHGWRFLGPLMGLSVLVGITRPAFGAAPGQPTIPARSSPPAPMTVTLSSGALLYNTAEVTLERRFQRGFSGAASLGVGHGRSFGDEAAARTMLKAGAQARYTFWGGFENGLGIAVQASVMRLSDDSDGVHITGVAIGPQLVWKWNPIWGLTFDVGAGAAWVGAMLGRTGSTMMMAHRSRLQAIGQLNVGWTFGGGGVP